MPRLHFTFVDPVHVPIAVPAPGFAANTCGAVALPPFHGGPQGTIPHHFAITAGDPQQNLPHLREPGLALDVQGWMPYTYAELTAAYMAASAASPPRVPHMPPAWQGIANLLRDTIFRSCALHVPGHPAHELAGTPIIEYLPPAAGQIWSRLDTTERVGLGYFMGVILLFLVAMKAGFRYLMHTKLLDLAAPPALGRGSHYLAGNKPDFLACSIPPGRLHVLEAKARMQHTGVLLGGAQGILGPALDQCNRYQYFRLPAAGIAPPPGLAPAVWGPANIFFAAPAAAPPGGYLPVVPTSRVACLANWHRASDRWGVWVTDPSENVPVAPPEFTDGYLRLYYAQYKHYFDEASPKDLETVNSSGVAFQTVALREIGMRVGIDERVLDLLKNEPANGYESGHLSKQIAEFTSDYENTHNEFDAYVSGSGIYTASLERPAASREPRTDPAAAG